MIFEWSKQPTQKSADFSLKDQRVNVLRFMSYILCAAAIKSAIVVQKQLQYVNE